MLEIILCYYKKDFPNSAGTSAVLIQNTFIQTYSPHMTVAQTQPPCYKVPK